MNSERPIKIKTVKSLPEDYVAAEETDGENKICWTDKTNYDRPDNESDIWTKIAKICLFLLVLLTPVFFLPLTAAPVETNKQILAVILLGVAFLCYLIRSINQRALIYPKSWLGLAVVALFGVAGASAIFSIARGISLWGNLIQPDSFLSFSLYGLAFFLASAFFNKEDFKKLSVCFLLGWALTAIFGLLQLFGKFIFPWNFSRQSGFNAIGSVLNLGIFSAAGLAMIIAAFSALEFSKLKKILLAVLGAAIFIVLLLINNQLIWFSLTLTMLALAIYKFAAKSDMTLSLVMIVVSLFFVLAGRQLPAFVEAPVEFQSGLSTTLRIAKNVWLEKRFLLGSGPVTFGFDYGRFRPVSLNQTALWNVGFNQGFSFCATVLSTLGVLGGLAVLFLVFTFIRRAAAVRGDGKLTVISVGTIFLAINLFLTPAFFAQMIIIFLGLGMLVGDSRASYEMDFYSDARSQNIRAFAAFLAVISLLSFSFFGLYSIGRKYAAAIYYGKVVASSSLSQSAARIEKAVKLNPQSDAYQRTLSQILLLKSGEVMKTAQTGTAAENQENLRLQFQNIISSAVNAARQATALNAADPLNWFNMGSIYENIMPVMGGSDVLALENYKKAMELEPANPQRPVDAARVLMISADQAQNGQKQEKLNQAREMLDKSLELKADYASAHFLLAQIYAREGNIDKVIAKVEDAKRNNLADIELAFQAGLLYSRVNQTELARNEFERAVALNPDYSNARYFLGLIYDQKGERQKAIEQFERIMRLNPENREAGGILDNLRSGKPAMESGI